MSERLTLYYKPGSYYSQKVVIALLEKNIPFNHRCIKLLEGEHIEPWYMKLNKAGKVPLLKDGDKLIPDSEDIIQYLDQQFPDKGDNLVVTRNTEYNRIHELLTKNTPIEIITYGTYINPELSFSGLRSSTPSPQSYIAVFTKVGQKAKELSYQYEELKDAYLEKSESLLSFLEKCKNIELVKELFDKIQPMFDEIENRLQQSTQDNPDYWLFGKDFTSADITLTVLLNRLNLLGQSERYYTETQRPHINQYWQRVQQRLSFKDLKELEKKA